jgi:YD repeat-containing protein
MTTYSYNERGNLLSKSVQATTDKTGALGTGASLLGTPRTVTYTYDLSNRRLSSTGPRTDVLQQTTMSYDAAGNLASVTNPLGHITSFENYDLAGRPHTIVRQNGVRVELEYSSRGWITKETKQGEAPEVTEYEYDGIGKLKKVIYPDATWNAFSYDQAHRLINISDSAGNTVTYTLDLAGNRIKEQVADPTGTLRRQISRSFDTLNNLVQVTGANQ